MPSLHGCRSYHRLEASAKQIGSGLELKHSIKVQHGSSRNLKQAHLRKMWTANPSRGDYNFLKMVAKNSANRRTRPGHARLAAIFRLLSALWGVEQRHATIGGVRYHVVLLNSSTPGWAFKRTMWKSYCETQALQGGPAFEHSPLYFAMRISR